MNKNYNDNNNIAHMKQKSIITANIKHQKLLICTNRKFIVTTA